MSASPGDVPGSVLVTVAPAALAAPTGPGSHAVLVDGWLHVSGMVARDRDGALVGVGDARAQTEQVLLNLAACLEAAGSCWRDVVKLVIYLVDISHRPIVSEVRLAHFVDHRPASTVIEVSALAHPDLLVEIEAIAYLGRS